MVVSESAVHKNHNHTLYISKLFTIECETNPQLNVRFNTIECETVPQLIVRL